MTKKKSSKKTPNVAPMFLLEQTMPKALEVIFPHTTDWIHNKNFLGCNFRPDYRSDSLKLCIEFDGYVHYTKAKVALDDIKKNGIVAGAGYKLVRIPYFVQLSAKTIKTMFGEKVVWKQEFPHGFINNEPTAPLPADFCELGIQRFMSDLKYFGTVRADIVNSLALRKEPIDLVLPPSLQHLVGPLELNIQNNLVNQNA